MWTVAFYRGADFFGICPNTKTPSQDEAGLWAQRYNLAFPYANGHHAAYFLPALLADSWYVDGPVLVSDRS